MKCSRCGSVSLIREPGSLRCLSCGSRLEVLDATDDQRLAQRTLDWFLRPRSYECWPEAVDFVPRRRVGDMRLPGEPMKRKR